jgi:hypothetical protein
MDALLTVAVIGVFIGVPGAVVSFLLLKDRWEHKKRQE